MEFGKSTNLLLALHSVNEKLAGPAQVREKIEILVL